MDKTNERVMTQLSLGLDKTA